MAISPEYITLLRVGISSSPEWKEAWERINNYLDALKTPETIDRELILLSSFERAISRKRQEPFTPATELAFEETQRTLDSTFSHYLPEDVPADRRSVEGRLRVYLTSNADSHLFNDQTLTGEVLEALRQVKLSAGPNLQIASITPKPLEFTSTGDKIIAWAERLSPLGAQGWVAWAVGLATVASLVLGSL
jgi:hypothetical protein